VFSLTDLVWTVFHSLSLYREFSERGFPDTSVLRGVFFSLEVFDRSVGSFSHWFPSTPFFVFHLVPLSPCFLLEAPFSRCFGVEDAVLSLVRLPDPDLFSRFFFVA